MKKKLAALALVLALVAFLGLSSRKTEAGPRLPQTFAPEPWEHAEIVGIQAQQNELNRQADACVQRARTHRQIPDDGRRFYWAPQLQNSRGWVLEGDPAPIGSSPAPVGSGS